MADQDVGCHVALDYILGALCDQQQLHASLAQNAIEHDSATADCLTYLHGHQPSNHMLSASACQGRTTMSISLRSALTRQISRNLRLQLSPGRQMHQAFVCLAGRRASLQVCEAVCSIVGAVGCHTVRHSEPATPLDPRCMLPF